MERGLLAAVLVIVLLTLACTDMTVPEGDPVQEGIIVARDDGAAASGSEAAIWVKDSLDEACGIWWDVNPGTVIWTRSDMGAPSEASLVDLHVDVRVRVWASGLIDTSCPGQAAASWVEIID